MKTNALNYGTSKKINYEGVKATIYVKIRLNDECNNGHQDFSITGNIYKGQDGNKSDNRHLTGGCIHDEIEKYFPEFKTFINLHLSDYLGRPMYCVQNGFYHLKNEFNNKEKSHKQTFCEYYRVSSDQYEILKDSENQLEFAILLKELGVLNK